jgi:hypothetical protein
MWLFKIFDTQKFLFLTISALTLYIKNTLIIDIGFVIIKIDCGKLAKVGLGLC